MTYWAKNQKCIAVNIAATIDKSHAMSHHFSVYTQLMKLQAMPLCLHGYKDGDIHRSLE